MTITQFHAKRNRKRNSAIALGLGLLLLSQVACESTANGGLTCTPPQVKTCTTDSTGTLACWCQ